MGPVLKRRTLMVGSGVLWIVVPLLAWQILGWSAGLSTWLVLVLLSLGALSFAVFTDLLERLERMGSAIETLAAAQHDTATAVNNLQDTLHPKWSDPDDAP